MIHPGSVFALYGPIGSGKTTFAKAVARLIGVEDAITSPSFTLVGEYFGRHPFYHIDLYRLSDPAEIDALALEEYVEGCGVTVIEWAERAEEFLPDHSIRVTFDLRADGSREIHIEQEGTSEKD